MDAILNPVGDNGQATRPERPTREEAEAAAQGEIIEAARALLRGAGYIRIADDTFCRIQGRLKVFTFADGPNLGSRGGTISTS